MISVIVPVYNVEDYLHYAMESLENQTYKDMEVLLVDDGSSDGSGLLCDQYAQQYMKISMFFTREMEAYLMLETMES